MKLSIVIPTIGRKALKTVVDNILLSKKNVQYFLEIIIVYDGDLKNISSSLELEILKQVQDDKQVVFLETGKKVYSAGARNMGIEKATGDVLVFIGDDTIPEPDWLEKIHQWHLDHPEPHEALLGRVKWIERLAQDTFHQWLEANAQFDYGRLDKGRVPSWRHFYTSNVSVKRSLLEDERFSDQFSGWGFEDTELGYRLAEKGMQLHYNKSIIVKHDDEQNLDKLIKNTQSARKNAQVFEQLHPELKILPRGLKQYMLCGMYYALWPLSFISEIKWWRLWKKHWLKTLSDPS